jgi:DNA-binding CsgD family transcriptional regulator
MDQARFYEIIDQLSQANSVEGIHATCSAVCIEYGFEHFLYGAQVPVSLVKPQTFIISGYPTEWWNHYKEQGYMAHDPTVAHCAVNTVPLVWSSIDRRSVSQPRAQQIMADANDFGLRNGLSIPTHGCRGESSMLSFTTTDADSRSTPRILQNMPLLQAVTPFVHEAARRVIEIKEIAPAKPKLTARENECLLWAAEGKTSWETSQILNISERTVVFHLQNAAAKLGVSGKQHAVARAISLGLISPQPA